MLKKKYRLPIQSVLGKSGKVLKTPFFLVKIFPNQFGYPRAGAVISKKISAKSTARNKLRRVIFSEAGIFFKKREQTAGKDFLIIPNPKIKNLDQKEIAVHLREVFDKIR